MWSPLAWREETNEQRLRSVCRHLACNLETAKQDFEEHYHKKYANRFNLVQSGRQKEKRVETMICSLIFCR